MRKTKIYKSLPHNPALTDKANALRKAGILHETLLWRELKSKKLNGLDFDRQKIIGNYIVDFYCAEKQVVIEADGTSHHDKQQQDAQRDAYLQGLGLVVIRLLAKDILQNMEGVIVYLKDHPALAGTPPREGNNAVRWGKCRWKSCTRVGPPRPLRGHPSTGGELEIVRSDRTTPSASRPPLRGRGIRPLRGHPSGGGE